MADQKITFDETRRIVRQLDGAKLEKLFQMSSTNVHDAASSVIAEIIWSGVLILRHPTAQQVERRDKFVAALKGLISKFGNGEHEATISKHLREAALIEMGFAEILASLEKADVMRMSPELQAWSVIDRAVDEIRILYERTFPPKSETTPIFHAQAPLVEDSKGNAVPADAVANGMVSFVANTLQMLGYSNDWFQENRLVLPPRVQTTKESRSQAGTHAYLASAWNVLLDSSERLRFFGKSLEEVQALEEDDKRRAIVFDLNLAPGRFFNIARLRQHQIQLEFAMRALVEIKGYQFGDPEKSSVQLPPHGYVSLDELVSVILLDAEYHYPVEDDSSLAGLSLRQWLRGYAVLKKMLCPELTAGHFEGDVVHVECEKLECALINAGFQKDQVQLFLKAVTFGRDKDDLWDAPLLQTADGKLFLVAPLFATADILAIVVSQLGRQRVQIPSKGDAFEAYVIEKFTSAGIVAKGFKYEVGEKSYQCDAAVLWDECLFVIECKNYLLPPESPAEEFHFLTSLNEGAEQADRIAHDLRENPEIIRHNFGDSAAFTDVCPIVLSALPFSYPPYQKRVFFYDASALSRFFDGDIFVSQTITVDGQPRLFEHRVDNLWTGESPTASDFSRQLRNPIQYAVERGLWSTERYSLELSNNWVLGTSRLKRRESSISSLLEASGWSEEEIEKFGSFVQELGDRLSDRKRKP